MHTGQNFKNKHFHAKSKHLIHKYVSYVVQNSHCRYMRYM